ncbi:hypothetical protein [Halomonas llamarensis]|uniref:Uncharacterized protein n=1 Tax=Halomonas llamarensis TaxID=2945104 RepID=A0ABT0SQQ4_9GAMM|nr:hypothetical protein [Halomonas llamarensis]MCL7929908.1 hypothetical protein [Halomonas llamarensis]
MPKEFLLATRVTRSLSWLNTLQIRSLSTVAAALVVWLIGIHLTWLPDTFWSRGITLAVLVLVLVFTATSWHRKASARFGVGILVIVAGLASVSDLEFSPIEGIGAFDTVILLLLGIGVLRTYLEKQNVATIIEKALGHSWLSNKPRLLFLLYGGMTFFLSLAVVPIVGTLTRKTALDYRQHLRIAMRAVGGTMFLAPTTVGAAAVSVMFPSLPWMHVLLMGLPLALATALLTRSGPHTKALPSISHTAETTELNLGLPIFLFLGILVLSQGVLGQATVTSVALAITIAGIGSMIYRYGVLSAFKAIHSTFHRSGAEILLFLACGTLQASLARLGADNLEQMVPLALSEHLTSTTVFAFVVIGGLPLLTILGIHPMILFAGFFPLFHPFANADPALEYLIWIAMFVVAQLVSPVSISAVTAAASIGAAPWTVSLASHGRFALAFTGLCVAYFTIISLI